MKVTVISTIRGKVASDLRDALKVMVSTLESCSHTVYHKHISAYTQADLDKMTDAENEQYHSELMKHLKQCDVVVCEASHPSLSVGYLVSYSIEMGKPTVLLYHEGAPEPNLLPTIARSDKVILEQYKSSSDMATRLKVCLEIASEKVDIRFNFFITPAINAYLNWVAKVKKVPRSVHIRNLIEQDMAANTEYSQT